MNKMIRAGMLCKGVSVLLC